MNDKFMAIILIPLEASERQPWWQAFIGLCVITCGYYGAAYGWEFMVQQTNIVGFGVLGAIVGAIGGALVGYIAGFLALFVLAIIVVIGGCYLLYAILTTQIS